MSRRFTDLEVKAGVKQHDFFIVAKRFETFWGFSSRSILLLLLFCCWASHNLMVTIAVCGKFVAPMCLCSRGAKREQLWNSKGIRVLKH